MEKIFEKVGDLAKRESSMDEKDEEMFLAEFKSMEGLGFGYFKKDGPVAEDHKEMQRRIKETLKILDNIANDVERAIDILRPRR